MNMSLQDLSSYITSTLKFWLTPEFFAIGLSSFLGVAIRVIITKQLESRSEIPKNPNTGYGPFIQMFYAQTYLIPNMLGCFIMSFCVAHTKSISDVSVPLFKFLTTGLCGCITTFSSWISIGVFQVFQSSWYEILIMIQCEFWLTWGAYSLGNTFAKILMESSYTNKSKLGGKNLIFLFQ